MVDLKYCPKCGIKIETQERFCKNCGTNLADHLSELEEPVKINQKIEPAVKLQVEYANIGERFVAFVIDLIIISLFTSILSLFINIGVFLSNPLFYWFNLDTFWISSIFNWGVGFLYFWLLETFNKGQSIGKIAMKLRTVDEKTLEISNPSNYAINNLAKPSAFFILDFLIGLLISGGDFKNRLRLLQHLSHTVVIKVP